MIMRLSEKPLPALGTKIPALLLIVSLIAFALTDLPAKVSFGPISGMAVSTIVLTILIWAFWLIRPTVTPMVWSTVRSFLLFFVWVIISTLLNGTTILGIQNLLVWVAFVGYLMLTAREIHHRRLTVNQIGNAMALGLFLMVATYAADSLLKTGIYTRLDGLWLGNRAVPLFGLLGLSWYLSAWRYCSRQYFWINLILAVFIMFTYARTASATMIILLVLARFDHKSKLRLIKLGLLGAIVAITFWLLINSYEPLRQRFFERDLSFQIASISINTTGRAKMWRASWDSFLESPLLGKGPGSSAEVTFLHVPPMRHPHNDYLRILHDYGLVGFGLWLIAFMGMLRRLWRLWRRADVKASAEARYHFTALLAAVVLALVMITDNIVVYIFVMAPLGTFAGISLTLATPSFVEAPKTVTDDSTT